MLYSKPCFGRTTAWFAVIKVVKAWTLENMDGVEDDIEEAIIALLFWENPFFVNFGNKQTDGQTNRQMDRTNA